MVPQPQEFFQMQERLKEKDETIAALQETIKNLDSKNASGKRG